jgi:hypothetical protein
VESIESLLASWLRYRQSRCALLAELGLPESNRDPLAEFSEVVVATLLGGSRATSRVQKGFDVLGKGGERIEVKYLANPRGRFINEHTILRGNWDQYALVCFEDLRPIWVLVFQEWGLALLHSALGKRHPRAGQELQFTWGNYRAVTSAPQRFTRNGLTAYQLAGQVREKQS